MHAATLGHSTGVWGLISAVCGVLCGPAPYTDPGYQDDNKRRQRAGPHQA